MTRYARDPRWLTTRYPGKCASCNADVPQGVRAFYYPIGRKLLCPACSEAAAAEFEAAAFDEEVMSRGIAEPHALYDATPVRFRRAPVARPRCRDCGGPLADERGDLLPYWDRTHPRCTRCHNRQARGEFIRRIPVFIADIVREDAPPYRTTHFPTEAHLAHQVLPTTAAEFHQDWEELQCRLGRVLRAYYYDRTNYLAAIEHAANALRILRYRATDEHRMAPDNGEPE